jgi:hypothetical protein
MLVTGDIGGTKMELAIFSEAQSSFSLRAGEDARRGLSEWQRLWLGS